VAGAFLLSIYHRSFEVMRSSEVPADPQPSTHARSITP
jgi:hypothetical protein